jgi:F420H(2)-dependent biliverdin reductase
METARRLTEERNVWLATTRPDGRPHLVPIWFVHEGGRFYICTQAGSVKARNLQNNANVMLALEDGDNAFVIEGTASAVQPAANVVRKFKEKFDWDITTDSSYGLVFEIEVKRQVMG